MILVDQEEGACICPCFSLGTDRRVGRIAGEVEVRFLVVHDHPAMPSKVADRHWISLQIFPDYMVVLQLGGVVCRLHANRERLASPTRLVPTLLGKSARDCQRLVPLIRDVRG